MFGRKQKTEERLPLPAPTPAQQVNQFVTFTGARMVYDDGAVTPRFEPWADIIINVSQIGAIYDNTIMVQGNKVRVMGSVNDIALKIMEAMRVW